LALSWLLVLALLTGGTPVEGVAFFYGESWDWGRIAFLNQVTLQPGETPIAVPLCADLGRGGRLWLGDAPVPLRVRTVDCGQPYDLADLLAKGEVAEVPWLIAQSYGFLETGSIRAVLVLDEQTKGEEHADYYAEYEVGYGDGDVREMPLRAE
jgi:hypothetical protein